MGRLRVLLDTSAFLWAISAPEHLSTRAAEVISSPKTQLFLSSVSLWEIAIKFNLGKLKLSVQTASDEWLREQMRLLIVSPLPVRADHSLNTLSLPQIHRDPFDRMLISQAMVEKLPFVTSDEVMKRYEIETIW